MNHRYIDSKLCLFENYKHLLTSESSLKTTQFKKNLSKMEKYIVFPLPLDISKFLFSFHKHFGLNVIIAKEV